MFHASPHHVTDKTYADTWEDCLVVGEQPVENASSAEYYGAPDGSTLVSLCDWTDGPRTRVRFFATDMIPLEAFGKDSEYRLKPDERGEFVVTEHQPTQNDIYTCVIMAIPDVTFVHVATVEKYVPIDLVPEQFPIGRRFTLERLAA